MAINPNMMTPYQTDILKEMFNIGTGKAASMLNEMLETHVSLSVPEIKTFSVNDSDKILDLYGIEKLSIVELGFNGSFEGNASLVFPKDSAIKLASILMGQEADESDMDSIMIGTISEVGNIIVNGIMGAISNILQKGLNFGLPDYREETLREMITHSQTQQNMTVILAQTKFVVERYQIEGDILLTFAVNVFNDLMNALEESVML